MAARCHLLNPAGFTPPTARIQKTLTSTVIAFLWRPWFSCLYNGAAHPSPASWGQSCKGLVYDRELRELREPVNQALPFLQVSSW